MVINYGRVGTLVYRSLQLTSHNGICYYLNCDKCGDIETVEYLHCSCPALINLMYPELNEQNDTVTTVSIILTHT